MLRDQKGYRWYQGALGAPSGIAGSFRGCQGLEASGGVRVHWGLTGSVGAQGTAWVLVASGGIGDS